MTGRPRDLLRDALDEALHPRAPAVTFTFTPICPHCGSVRVEARGALMYCECGAIGRAAKFDHATRAEALRSPLGQWRDGSTLSMDGQDATRRRR